MPLHFCDWYVEHDESYDHVQYGIVHSSQARCHSLSLQRRPPAAAQAALACACVTFVHGRRAGFEQARWLIEPADVAVASGREAS